MSQAKYRPSPTPQFNRQQLIAPWMSWPSLAVVLTNVPKELGTVDIWKAFKEEGSIVSIDIWEDSHGGRGTKAKVRFK